MLPLNCLAACVTLLLASAPWALAQAPTVALDAPGQKTITVRSEILRGWSAVKALPSSDATLPNYLPTFRSLLAQNEQANTDSEGFLLGAHFAFWSVFGTRDPLWTKRSERAFTENEASIHQHGRRGGRAPIALYDQSVFLLRQETAAWDISREAPASFRRFRLIQRRLGISDDALCEACGSKLENLRAALAAGDQAMVSTSR